MQGPKVQLNLIFLVVTLMIYFISLQTTLLLESYRKLERLSSCEIYIFLYYDLDGVYLHSVKTL